MTTEPSDGTAAAGPRAAAGHTAAHTVVAAALCRGGQVLLCHRAPDRRWYPNVWDLPGGHVDGGESPHAALVSELAEELAVDVLIADVAAAPHFRWVDPELHLSVWRIDHWKGEPLNKALDEHDQIAWVDFTSALTLPLAHPAYPDMFQSLAHG